MFLNDRVKSIAVIILFFLFSNLFAGQQLKFKGFIQNWFSYTKQGSGFNIRRVMLKSYGKINPDVSWYAQYGWNQQKPALMDAAVQYSPDELLNIKVGRFSVPGTKFGSLTSSSQLTFIERSMIIKKWNSFNGYTSFRSVGLQIGGEINKFIYKTMFSNNQAETLYTPSMAAPTYNESEALRFIGRVEYKLGELSAGAFFSSPIKKEPLAKSFGGDLIISKQPIKFRTGYIQGERKPNSSKITYSGLITEVSWAFANLQPTIRYDFYNPISEGDEAGEVDVYQNITFGLNYYPIENIKLQANYLLRKEKMRGSLDEYDNNLLYFNIQYSFDDN
ncbi:MAG: OprO/OprP family phosphate-selective porin [Candidatus Marinimicrobia bacterium]|nr:OprO/OprP family phosphate-selective porin [Candidatus Neomarinimicrobiota bacterium]